MHTAPRDETDLKVFNWIRAHMPGEITSFARQPRWRPAWEVEIEQNGTKRGVLVRGARGRDYVSPISLPEEAEIHHVLERHKVIAPKVYGLIEDPVAIVMEKLPGQINLAAARDDAARRSLREHYVQILAQLHAIPPEHFLNAGLKMPASAAEIALSLYDPCIAIFRRRIGRPFPLMHFIASWLHRNIPQHRTRAAFITADAGQFLYEGDRLTGLIDFEVSYLGDPAAEFAGMRLRDTVEPMGDISALADRYEQLTGDHIDKKTVEFHTAGFCAVTGFLMWPLAFNLEPEQDYIAHLHFSVATTRWAIQAMADSLGITLIDPPVPSARQGNFSMAARHLVRSLNLLQKNNAADVYNLGSAEALALYLQHWNDYGLDILKANLADLSELLRRRVTDWDPAQGLLETWIDQAGPEQDAKLCQYFHNWLCRQDFLLRECGSQAVLTGSKLQAIPQR